MHHELHKVEEAAWLPARLVVSDAIKHRLELLPTHKPIAILVNFPDHILDCAHRKLLVLQPFQTCMELLFRDLAKLLLHENVEDALQILELLRFVVLAALPGFHHGWQRPRPSLRRKCKQGHRPPPSSKKLIYIPGIDLYRTGIYPGWDGSIARRALALSVKK